MGQLFDYLIPALAGLAVALIVIGFGSGNKKWRGRESSNDGSWLWSNGLEKLYDAVFQNMDPLLAGKKLGLEYDKYMVACNVIEKKPNLKKEVINRAIATFLLVISAIAALLAGNPMVILIGLAAYYFMAVNVVANVQSKAKQKRSEILADLPRFADLLHSALIVGIPIELALELTSKNLSGLLASEMMQAMAVMKMGADSWQGALESVAKKYEVDTFSDFVLDLITASKKGVPILEAVARKSVEIKQSNILNAKERVSKMSNNILLPVMIFKILPLILLLIIPVFTQVYSNL